MDITKTEHKLFTNKLINGETVNFAVGFAGISFIFIILKQFFKIALGLSGSVAVGISYAIATALLYFWDKKYVFHKDIRTKLPVQILSTIIKMLAGAGFYKLCSFLFGDILKANAALVFMICATVLLVFNYYFDKLLVFDNHANPKDNQNGRIYHLFFDNRFLLLSGFVAALSFTFVCIVTKAFPFGDNTVMRMDLYHQYGPLYCELYDRVLGSKSFIYSWNAGGGTGFLGNYFNYLSSPLSFIVLLFDRGDMPYAVSAMVYVKGMLSAISFSYYLKKSQNSHTYASSAFGVLYAFCAYFLAYYWNIMWLDGMILFPLIILGIETIINEKKPILYIATLTLLLYSTYYIGFMTCLFAVVYFLAYMAISDSKAAQKPSFKKSISATNSEKVKAKIHFSLTPFIENRFINRGVIFAGSSLLAGALCAVSLIPIYMILQRSSATSDSFPSSMESYFDLINLLSSHLAKLETTIRSSGDDVLPNIYCGMLPAMLLPLYMMNKKISLREKTVYTLLIIFFVFSFDNNMANFIWHAMHFPNDLPYRFSFMYSFIILVIGYKTLRYIRALEIRDIAVSGIIWLLLILFYQKFPTEKITESTIYISLAMIMIWTAVLMLIRSGKMNEVVLGVTVVCMVFSEVIIADTSAFNFNWSQTEYMSNYENYRDALQYVEEKDDDFYRQELCYLDTRMDPCLYGYNGVSIFSSMAYEDLSQLQYSLGMFGNRVNSYTYNTQTPVYNMMFAIKYITQSERTLVPSKDFYSHYYSIQSGDARVFKNERFLPIAYTVSSDVTDWETAEGDPFEVQEDFIDRAAGVSNVFKECEYVSTVGYNCDCEDVTENGIYSFSKDEDSDGGSIDITIRAVNDSNLYVYITSPEITNVNYFWDNEEDTASQNIDEPYIMDLGKHKKGDEIRIELSLAGMETDSSALDIYAYNINKDVFDSAYELLETGKLNVTNHSATTIEGTVDAGFDGILYSSIPYDEGWSVTVDGKKAETIKIGDSLLGVSIKKGKHTVRYHFTPEGLNYGAVISGAAWLSVLVWGIYRAIDKKSKKRL